MIPRFPVDQDARKRQIDTLKIFNDNVIEVQESCEYRVEFIAGNKKLNMDVVLTPEFPDTYPLIFINPIIPHPWLSDNTNQVTGAPGLINFTRHSDLGRIVQAIIREFQRSVPNTSHSEETVIDVPQPITSNSICPELAELTIEELQEILENTDLQDKLLENTPQLIELDLETEELMCNIEKIAQDNLEKQSLLDSLKTDVIDRISTIVQMKMNYEELNNKHQKLSEKYDPHHIRDCLKEAALKADEDAEVIAEQFLHGNLPVETFVTKFAEKRAMGQARRAREERFAHQLTQLDRATS